MHGTVNSAHSSVRVMSVELLVFVLNLLTSLHGCVYVRTITFWTKRPWPRYLARWFSLSPPRSDSMVKVIAQISRLHEKRGSWQLPRWPTSAEKKNWLFVTLNQKQSVENYVNFLPHPHYHGRIYSLTLLEVVDANSSKGPLLTYLFCILAQKQWNVNVHT